MVVSAQVHVRIYVDDLGTRVPSYMIVVEEEHEQETDRKGDKNPFHRNIPEIYYPRTVNGRVESQSMLEGGDLDIVEGPRDVREAGPEDGGNLQ